LGGSDNHTFNFAGAVPLNPHQTPDVELSIITTASLSANAVSRWAEVDLDYTVEPLTSNFNISGVE
jgi:hypothetical protein